MKKKTVSKLVVLLAALALVIGMIAGCGSSNETPAGSGAGSAAAVDADAEAAANVDALIAAIQVQEW
ncbi:MAG: cobalt chelatase, partial [Lachnospiraceae bacterium]|nr:cobalt chelatase [Lachnospiraceae bacterium]